MPLQQIAELAKTAGDFAAKQRKVLSNSEIHTKSTDTDLVTDVDRDVETLIVKKLQKITPGYGIFGEETGKSHADAPYCWVIDPTDGMTGFVRDQPFYCVSIGLRHHGVGVLGAVYAPKLGELFLAEAGHGATRNGETICVSDASDLQQAVVATGFSCIRAKRKFDNMELLPAIARDVRLSPHGERRHRPRLRRIGQDRRLLGIGIAALRHRRRRSARTRSGRRRCRSSGRKKLPAKGTSCRQRKNPRKK